MFVCLFVCLFVCCCFCCFVLFGHGIRNKQPVTVFTYYLSVTQGVL